MHTGRLRLGMGLAGLVALALAGPGVAQEVLPVAPTEKNEKPAETSDKPAEKYPVVTSLDGEDHEASHVAHAEAPEEEEHHLLSGMVLTGDYLLLRRAARRSTRPSWPPAATRYRAGTSRDSTGTPAAASAPGQVGGCPVTAGR